MFLYCMCCSVNGSVCLVCLTVFVNCLVTQFAMCLGVVAILLLNAMEVFSVGSQTGRSPFYGRPPHQKESPLDRTFFKDAN